VPGGPLSCAREQLADGEKLPRLLVEKDTMPVGVFEVSVMAKVQVLAWSTFTGFGLHVSLEAVKREDTVIM